MDYASILKKGGSGVRASLPIVVLFGEGGVGKTTFASKAPNPAFLCGEDGAHAIPGVTRFPNQGTITTWDEMMAYTAALARGEHDFKTLVADSADALAALCIEKLVAGSGKTSYEKMGWGKEDALALKWREWLVLLEECRNRGMMVFLIAHVQAKSIVDPTIGSYTGFIGKMNKELWGITYNWADIVLFAKRERSLYQPNENQRARAFIADNDPRYLYAESGTGFEAKQRAGFPLPKKMPLDYAIFAEALAAKSDDVIARIEALVKEIADDDVTAKAKVLVTQAGADVAKLRGIENGLKVKLNEKNKEKAA